MNNIKMLSGNGITIRYMVGAGKIRNLMAPTIIFTGMG
jgi:hypothetical protein